MATHRIGLHGRVVAAARRLRLAWRQLLRRLSLSRVFLAAATTVVVLAMVGLGNWIGIYLTNSITRGVATTAAASIESLIVHNFVEGNTRAPLSAEDRARLDRVFRIGNDATTTRLLQIRIRDLDGDAIYESSGGTTRSGDLDDFRAAAAGEVVARVLELPRQAADPQQSGVLPVLEIHTPLRHPDTGEFLAVAELLYSARSIHEIRTHAQLNVWILVCLAAIALVAALYLLVDRANRMIESQRARLARNLASSRRLAEENRTLRSASERLRIEANFANERLLAQVGSDLHDGPVQLLALLILRLSKGLPSATDSERADLASSTELAREVMEELRSLSSGLVLPELADLTLEETVSLAIERHEGATGTEVTRELDWRTVPTSMVTKICAFRVVQEGLNNAFWHGRGARARVALQSDGAHCRITVSNPARTTEPVPVDDERVRLGLRSMRYRVESLGGTLSIEGGLDRATTVSACIPLNAQIDQSSPPSLLTLPIS